MFLFFSDMKENALKTMQHITESASREADTADMATEERITTEDGSSDVKTEEVDKVEHKSELVLTQAEVESTMKRVG